MTKTYLHVTFDTDLHVTFDLNATDAILGLPEGSPMRLNWPEFPDAFARYMGHLTDGNVSVSQLRLTEKILMPVVPETARY